MDRNIEIVNLYESYKDLLTKNMREIFELYYYDDLSLREIGENKGITHQACRDSIKNTEKQILKYENKLGLNRLKTNINKALKIMSSKSIENALKVKSVKKILKD